VYLLVSLCQDFPKW